MAGRFDGLNSEQWEVLAPIFGQPEDSEAIRRRGRPPVNRRYVLNSILYVLITSCPWCYVPIGEQWAKRSTAHFYLGTWAEDGTFLKLKDSLLEIADLNNLIDWERGSADGSFSAGKGGGDDVGYGFKGKGVTRHTYVDGNGMPLAIITTSANVDERTQVIKLLDSVSVKGNRVRAKSCTATIQLDGGYPAKWLKIALRKKGIQPVIAEKVYKNRKQKSGRKAPKQIDRYKVERYFAWSQTKFRRLTNKWERRRRYWEGFVLLSMSLVWFARLGQKGVFAA